MTPETPSLTPKTDTFEAASWGNAKHDSFKWILDFARTLETRALSAEADNARLRGVLERCVEALERYPEQPENGIDLVQVALTEAAAILSKP